MSIDPNTLRHVAGLIEEHQFLAREASDAVRAAASELEQARSTLPAKPTLKLRPIGPVRTPRPRYAKPGDAGLDLAAAIRPGIVCRDADGNRVIAKERVPGDEVYVRGDTLVLEPGASAVIPCGWAFAIPAGHEGQVRPRSSASERRIHVATGTVDSGYRGEVCFIVENRTCHYLEIKSGERLAQMVIAPIAVVEIEEAAELDETERGATGFGSSGS